MKIVCCFLIKLITTPLDGKGLGVRSLFLGHRFRNTQKFGFINSTELIT